MTSIIKSQSGISILIASMLLMLIFGSVHVFSVFLSPMENYFQSSRAETSLIYSIALISLTFAVFLGHRLYGLVRPIIFIFIFCMLAILGLVITAYATKLIFAYIGFGLLFGFSNGLAYGFSLHICVQAYKENKGLAIGLITASYAIGNILVPWPLTKIIESSGIKGGLLAFALTVLVMMLIAMFLYSKNEIRLNLTKENNDKNEISKKPKKVGLVSLLWFSYGCAVTAGLMSLGHATGIAEKADVSTNLIIVAPIIIAAFNMTGSLLGGWMADHFSPRLLLCSLPVVSSLSLLALAFILSGDISLIGLGIVGFTYGAIIAAYPAVISTVFGAVESIRIYGIVFTALGVAGFLGPWLAGIFYDSNDDYQFALIAAAIAGILSATISFYALKKS